MSQAGTYNAIGIIPTSAQFVTDVAGPVGVVGGVLNIVGGAGIATVGIAPNTVQINMTAPYPILLWTREAGAAVAMAINHGYVPTNGGLTTFMLPLVAPLGSLIYIVGESAGQWSIHQNAGQSIQYVNTATTVGAAGHLDSANQFDTVTLVCRVANTTWAVISSVGFPLHVV
jgi:hypothetical protein